MFLILFTTEKGLVPAFASNSESEARALFASFGPRQAIACERDVHGHPARLAISKLLYEFDGKLGHFVLTEEVAFP